MSEPKSNLPDPFDRALAMTEGIPDTIRTKPTVIQHMPPLGVGGSATFIVQTVRHTAEGESSRDTVFLQVADASGMTRLVIPSRVADAIARQRDALTGKSRSAAGRRVAADRKARGEKPAFMKSRKKS